ncbi:MAG: hypothetical protein AAFX93_03825 [Verrucomicrobiota bacterium]
MNIHQKILPLFAALVLFCVNALADDTIGHELTDQEIAERLMGKWNETVAPGMVATNEFLQDGVYVGTLDVEGNDEPVDASFKGNWTVTAGRVIYVVKESSIPFPLLGKTIKDKVISIDAEKFVYRGDPAHTDAEEHTMVKIKE